ncbi:MULTISPECIES: cysteine desulfurase sulfur acceptor subunit CsdE [Vibrio]|uniref:Cysteine desulfurase sulfur acceptor subunit CsdE n=2 Tax=Vibrio TaxID=662 RepID=A0A7X4RT56_9VIBR|nr:MULTISPECIES: cysteine desulfurase sulfur acceptor subunit CsdE [Vibrio]MBF8999333.1 cysteine desulfurase sulfur acceptor subunit CsdE [Vibrio nitrifigilis]MZI91719.1 cysteine desulfurase sulfur acceptor subunit CsdE [Vibrio eleionomae]
MSSFPSSPFGTDISSEQVVDVMSQFTSWEDRYRQIVMWGKKLPIMDDECKSETIKVSGCESQVWLIAKQEDNGLWYFHADSDARIVRGLIAIVMAAYNGHTAEQIQQFDIDGYFTRLNLLSHLSPSRGNGLKAIVDQVKNISQ